MCLNTQRYELSQDGMRHIVKSSVNYYLPTYRWAQVNCPFLLDFDELSKQDIPLKEEHVTVFEIIIIKCLSLKVLHRNVPWCSIAWGKSSVKIREKTYELSRIYFFKKQKIRSQQI